MILACPNCMARYRVRVEALGAMGRRVRCSRCGHVWHAEPPGYKVEIIHAEPEPDRVATRPEPDTPAERGSDPVAAAGPESIPPVPEPDSAPAADVSEADPPRPQLPVPARPAPQSRGPSLWTWILSLLILALCVVGYEARHSIAKEWPWLAPAYEALGMAVEDGQGTQAGQPE